MHAEGSAYMRTFPRLGGHRAMRATPTVHAEPPSHRRMWHLAFIQFRPAAPLFPVKVLTSTWGSVAGQCWASELPGSRISRSCCFAR